MSSISSPGPPSLHLNHATNAYLTIYLTPSSSYLSDPPSLCAIHPALAHVGAVGAMRDAQILSVPKTETGWLDERVRGDVVAALEGRVGAGIQRVEVMAEPRTRAKRGEL
ncbi:hypothetical protein BU17DRAFT_65061 [Hysterangium stoloniferum]|nr:hypothetical protein BU17DRAFT_65061 [Hysterangium stoloniferum]